MERTPEMNMMLAASILWNMTRHGAKPELIADLKKVFADIIEYLEGEV